MLISPEELQAAAKRAAEQKAAAEAKAANDREIRDRLRKEFESACLSAALRRKTRISFNHAIADVVNLNGFAVEEIKSDLTREQFLARKRDEVESQVASQIVEIAAGHPDLVVKVFPNRLSKDFRGLVEHCLKQDTAEEVVAAVKRQLSLLTSFSSEAWAAFDGKCIVLARDCQLLDAVRMKHAKIAEANAAIPKGLAHALRISWDSATPEFGKFGAFSASKLKWISSVWPRWERHFNADLAKSASDGQTSKEWIFSSAKYWGEDDSFAVWIEDVPAPDVDSMSDEERRIHFYWKEIEERDGKIQQYDEEEGVLIGVHPLPVAEILSSQGFKVSIEERCDEDEDGNVEAKILSVEDWDALSVDADYQLSVSWGGS